MLLFSISKKRIDFIKRSSDIKEASKTDQLTLTDKSIKYIIYNQILPITFQKITEFARSLTEGNIINLQLKLYNQGLNAGLYTQCVYSVRCAVPEVKSFSCEIIGRLNAEEQNERKPSPVGLADIILRTVSV